MHSTAQAISSSGRQWDSFVGIYGDVTEVLHPVVVC